MAPDDTGAHSADARTEFDFLHAVKFAATHRLQLIPTGSYHTCSPRVEDTDRDYVVFAKSPMCMELRLLDDGWVLGGSEAAEGQKTWNAYRKGVDNLIVMSDPAQFDSFVAATEIATALNLLRKEDRVKLFTMLEARWPGVQN